MIPIDEQHIRQIFKAWVRHYNGTRPHSSLGPGIPGNKFQKVEPQVKRHRIPEAFDPGDFDTRWPSPRIQTGEDRRSFDRRLFLRTTTKKVSKMIKFWYGFQDAVSFELARQVAAGLSQHSALLDLARSILERWSRVNSDAPTSLNGRTER
jgi:hypothetical protein